MWFRTSANVLWVINKRKLSIFVLALDAAFFKPTETLGTQELLCLETRPTFRTLCGLLVKWISEVLFLSFMTPIIFFSVSGMSNLSWFLSQELNLCHELNVILSRSFESSNQHFHFLPHLSLLRFHYRFYFHSHYLPAHLDLKLEIVIGEVKLKKLKKVLF